MVRKSNSKAVSALKEINKMAKEYHKKHPTYAYRTCQKEAGKQYRKKHPKKK